MWTNDILTKGYDTGTFKLGQSVYHIKNKRHMFKYKKECAYCDNTGKVNIKGQEFICPNCNCQVERKEVIEKIVDEPVKIKSVINNKNKQKSLEIYCSDSSGYGLIICKQDNGDNMFFASQEDAQKVCDKINTDNKVYILIEKYNRLEAECMIDIE